MQLTQSPVFSWDSPKFSNLKPGIHDASFASKFLEFKFFYRVYHRNASYFFSNLDGTWMEIGQLEDRIPIKPGIHDTSFASKSPFKKTWIKKT